MKALPAPSAVCEQCGEIQEGAIAVPGLRCDRCIAAGVDAQARRTRTHAMTLISAGAVFLMFAALLWNAGVDDARHHGSHLPLPVWVGILGIGCAAVGFGMLRYRPKLEL
jgi:hypothetical protein